MSGSDRPAKRRKLSPESRAQEIGSESPALEITDTESNSNTDSGRTSHAADVASQPDDKEREQKAQLRALSFGVLADAQDALPSAQRVRKRDQNDESRTGKEQKLEGLRERLAELREKKTGKRSSESSREPKPEHERDTHRSSKHAPTEQSSKKQVTRRRDVTDASHLYDADSRAHRLQGDPRFNAASGSVDREKTRRNYAFLSEYAQHELQDLRASLEEGKRSKRNKLTAEQETNLKKEIVRRENRMKTEAQREREREIASKHKREERQKVSEGKTPYYMKKGQVKELARKEMWEGMKKGQQEKSEQKRRRRQEAKTMKRKPAERRV
ncbi:MAG: hypothetical protein Q9159_005259 [Coniocarpon cinnabarinum]